MSQNTSGMIANAVDNESMVILTQPTSSTQSITDFNTKLENTVVDCLAAHIPASVISAASTSTNEVVSAISSNFTITPVSTQDRDTFDIQTTTDVSDISFALISQYDSSVQETPDSYSCNIGTPNKTIEKDNSIIVPSASIYDSNVAFKYEYNGFICPSTSNNANEAYPTDVNGTIPDQGTWQATFDAENSNANYSRAVNSEYNTKNYSRPMRVDEYTLFNKTYALGKDMTNSSQQHYFTLDSNGKPIKNDIDMESASSENGYMEPTFLLGNNGIMPSKSSDFENIGLDDCGSYRLQQFPDAPLITITEDEVSNDTTSQSSISKFPIFNANPSPDQVLPTNTITLDTFYSMFNRDYTAEGSETIMPEYKYTVTVNEADNSGYSPAADMIARTDVGNTFTLDDSNLLDNATYMEHYVNGDHTLSFASAGLNITTVDSASSDNIEQTFSLNTEREYITKSNFDNGQIKVNNNTPTTRTNIDENSLAFNQNVFYNSEHADYTSISDELKQNASVTYLSQLVAKNSKDVSGSFMKNTGSRAGDFALDLYKNNIVNSNFNSSDFGFTVPNPRDVEAEVFKVNSFKQLASINGFSILNSGVATRIDGVSAFANLRNMKTILINNDNVYDKAKMKFTLKDLVGSSIHTAVSNATGWSVTSLNGAKMASSSAVAYGAGSVAFPKLADTISLIKQEDDVNEINYRISVTTATTGSSDNASSSSHLGDYVKIEWSTDNYDSNNNSILLTQDMLTRVQTQISISPIDETTKVSNSLILDGKLTGKQIDVYQVTSIRDITYTFDLPLRPFTGLQMTTPKIRVTTNSYIAKDNVTGEVYPKSYLKYVSDNTQTNYSKITESLSSIDIVEGVFNSTDLCDMMVTVFKQDTDNNTLVQVAQQTHISSMYGIETAIELYESEEEQSNPEDISLSIECEYLNAEGSELNVNFDNIDGYELQLTSTYNTNYTCEYWTANMENITNDTSIANPDGTLNYSDKILTVFNGYNSVTKWNTSDYEAIVSYEEDDKSTIVLSIREKETSTSLYEIRTKKFTYLNTTAFISYFPRDIYRNDRWIGEKGDDDEIYYNEHFNQVDYTYINNQENTLSNIFSIDTGVYLTTPTLSSTTFTQLSDIGKLIKFSLLSDSIGVNMISTVTSLNSIAYLSSGTVSSSETNHTISNHGLTFQYVDEISNSRKFTIDRYRGFYGPEPNTVSVDQVYTINRDTMVATLTIARSSSDEYDETISQSWNVYQDEEYTVDNLSGEVGSIGLKIKFLLSMLAVEGLEISVDDKRSFTIFRKGDDVTFIIVNPNTEYLYRTTPDDTTLKQFVLDTFSGSNFNETGSPLSINSYRLKIRTQNSSNLFEKSNASWSVQLNPREVRIYKNNNYLGNPANLDTNDAYVRPDSELWTDTTPEGITYTFLDLIGDNGITSGKWNFKRSPLNYNPSISYFVIMPPYILFNQVYSDIIDLPYDFSEETDLRVSYLPVAPTVNDKNTYNPFAESTTYNYIADTDEVSSVTLTFNQTLTNDVTFVQTAPESLLSSYTYDIRDEVPTQYFVVEGNILTKTLVAGLKSQSGSTIGTMFGPLPVNRLMYLVNNSSHFYNDTLINSNSGIVMKLLQPTNIQSTPYILSTSDIYSTQTTIDANITIQIDNFFGKNTFALDLPAGAGTKVNLYTREMVNSSNNYTIRIYKYSGFNNINVDYNDVNGNGSPSLTKQAVSVTFLERSYKTFTIDNAGFKTFLQSLTTGNIRNAFEEYVKIHAQEFAYDLKTQEWILDETWPTSNEDNIYNSVYASVVCFSADAMTKIPPKVFSTTYDGISKAFYVSKHPIFTSFDKLGRKQFQITSWGSITVPSVSAGSTIYNNTSNTAPTGNISNLFNNHQSGFSQSNIA